MDWINLHIPSVIRSPEFIGSSPAERGTWLSVLAYACGIECGGRLIGAATWKDRQWQQSAGVTLREVRTCWKLLAIDGDDVVVNGYPSVKEKHVQQARGVAKAGAMAKWSRQHEEGRARHAERHADAMPNGNAVLMPTGMPNGNAEGEGEGKGKGKGKESGSPIGIDQGDLTSPGPAPKAATAETHLVTLKRFGLWLDRDDPDARAVALETIAEHGGAKLVAAAERLRRENPKGRIFLDRLVECANGAGGPTPEGNPRLPIVQRLISDHGWERCADASGIPRGAIGGPVAMEQAMVADLDIHDRVVAALGVA